MSLKDQILNADDRPTIKTRVPEWGCDVYIKSLSGNGRTEVMAAMLDDAFEDAEKN